MAEGVALEAAVCSYVRIEWEAHSWATFQVLGLNSRTKSRKLHTQDPGDFFPVPVSGIPSRMSLLKQPPTIPPSPEILSRRSLHHGSSSFPKLNELG